MEWYAILKLCLNDQNSARDEFLVMVSLQDVLEFAGTWFLLLLLTIRLHWLSQQGCLLHSITLL